MREVAYAEELKHYVSRVEHYKKEIEEDTKALELKQAKLEVLNEVFKSLEPGTGKAILLSDIESAKKEIVELKRSIIHARGNLKTFESIVEAFNS